MKKLLVYSVAILAIFSCANSVWATEFSVAIEGRIVRVEPSKSIVIEIKKSQSIELGLADIESLAVRDSKDLIDGVGTTAIIGGASGGIIARVGVIDPPKSIQPSESKIKNAAIAGITAAGFSATGRILFNLLTQKSPTIIYDINSESLKEPAVINLLPIGTKVRIIQKNHINGNMP
ncbi:MAG: hypothetical protein HYT61_02960 [Candidatus Yanofskybacteria bacterium]|nr:hypothetical protein [Candidatus Yanofskybacteria bacterium]